MARILSKKIVTDYLEALVSKNADLQHFIGTAPQQLDDALGSSDGLPGATLNFYGYRWKLSGNNQRSFNTRTISFAIITAHIGPEDYADQEDAIEAAEAIGLEVLSRVYQDSKREELGWLYNNMLQESIQAEEIRAEKAEGLYGMDFSFDIKVSEPLVVTPGKWTDGNLFCS